MTRYGKSTFEVRVQRINETPGSIRVDDPISAVAYWREKIAVMPWYDPEREMCVSIMLNTRLSAIGHTLVGIGSLNECVVHARDVFRGAVAMGSYGVLVLHNHPSGEASPSAADRAITKRLVEAGQILQISVLDHVIVGANSHYSFREAGLV